jgi:hypothetical protein
MTLPQAARMDLLDFLGGTPVSPRQVDMLILSARQAHKRAEVEAYRVAVRPDCAVRADPVTRVSRRGGAAGRPCSG